LKYCDHDTFTCANGEEYWKAKCCLYTANVSSDPKNVCPEFEGCINNRCERVYEAQVGGTCTSPKMPCSSAKPCCAFGGEEYECVTHTKFTIFGKKTSDICLAVQAEFELADSLETLLSDATGCVDATDEQVGELFVSWLEIRDCKKAKAFWDNNEMSCDYEIQKEYRWIFNEGQEIQIPANLRELCPCQCPPSLELEDGEECYHNKGGECGEGLECLVLKRMIGAAGTCVRVAPTHLEEGDECYHNKGGKCGKGLQCLVLKRMMGAAGTCKPNMTKPNKKGKKKNRRNREELEEELAAMLDFLTRE